MKSDYKMKCQECGSLLPGDSEFCQYCGSKNVYEYIEQEPVYDFLVKKCSSCGKELPEDSEFCQYCGSKKIVIKNGKNEKKEDNYSLKQNVLLIPLILVSLLAAGLGYGMYYNYENFNLLEEAKNSEITNLNTKLSRARNDAAANQKKANYYDAINNYSKNINGYSDFYARQTLLKKPNKQIVWIYFGQYGGMSAQASSGAVRTEWGNWSGHWCPLTITYTGSGVQYVKITNDVNSEEICIVIIGN